MGYLIFFALGALVLVMGSVVISLVWAAAEGRLQERKAAKWESEDRQTEWRLAARAAEYPDATTTLSATGGWFIAADDFEPSPGQYPAFDPRDLLPPEAPDAD